MSLNYTKNTCVWQIKIQKVWVGWGWVGACLQTMLVLVLLPYKSPFLLFFCIEKQRKSDQTGCDFLTYPICAELQRKRRFLQRVGVVYAHPRTPAHAITPKGF